jgi:hypothetical protein
MHYYVFQEEFWSMEFIRNFDSLLFSAAILSVEEKGKNVSS